MTNCDLDMLNEDHRVETSHINDSVAFISETRGCIENLELFRTQGE